MFGYIYETTNLINGKKYIGKHISSIFDVNYLGSGTHLKNAINKYGKENFEVRLIEKIKNLKDRDSNKLFLAEREIYWIKYFNAVKDNYYYNVYYGGNNEGWNYDHSGYNNPMYHHKYTKQQIENIRNGAKNRPRHSEETKLKIGRAQLRN